VRRVACAGKLSAAVVAGLLLAEAGFRMLLFGESAAALRLGARLRVPSAFADADESDHWKLLRLFQPRAMRKAQRFPDPVTGWIRRPYDLASVERELAGRRPVLLFGDSYAQCTTPECSRTCSPAPTSQAATCSSTAAPPASGSTRSGCR
jgi:hypothetical protein